jgi:peptide chain release factor subunit 1
MQVAALDDEVLRRLAEIQLERPLVLSLYLDFNPSEFATPPARATAVRSVLDAADRTLRERNDELDHSERADLQGSLEQARELLSTDLTDVPPGLAVFVSRRQGLFETIGLARPVPNCVAIDRSPLVRPLTNVAQRERWCVVLVSRRDARVFRGSTDGLREVDQIRDDVPGQHDQGGWSQARYQRSVEKDVADHLKNSAERLLEHWKRQPFQRLVLGGPREVVAEFEGKLHDYLADRVAGHIEVDVDTASPQQVLEASRDLFESLEEQHEREAIERLDEGSRGVAGLEEVLPPLNERRVETLLLDEGQAAPGTLCPTCGWLGPMGEQSCPVDGTPLEARDDITEPAIELAIQQSAEVLPLRRLADELRQRGGVAALLRF